MASPGDSRAQLELEWIAAAEEFMRASLREKFDRVGLARHLGISVDKLYRIFLSHGKPSPARTLMELRVHHGARLLLERACTVKQAANESGYASVRKFADAFKKVKGMNPSSWHSAAGPAPPLRVTKEMIDQWLPASPRSAGTRRSQMAQKE